MLLYSNRQLGPRATVPLPDSRYRKRQKIGNHLFYKCSFRVSADYSTLYYDQFHEEPGPLSSCTLNKWWQCTDLAVILLGLAGHSPFA